MNFGDILHDPELETSFVLTRSNETVNHHGRVEFTDKETPLDGVILPATEKQLERLPEEHRSSEVISIYCETLLSSGGEDLAADRVAWSGEEYEIISVKDFIDVAGFCEALAKPTSAMGRGVV